MADFQDVINTIEEEGESFRKLLDAQKKSGESPAKRDAKATSAIKREEKTNSILKEILKSLGVGGSGGSGESVKSSDGLGLLGLSLGSATFSALIAGIAMLTDTDAAIKAFGLPKTFKNIIGALKLLKSIVLLPFTITGKLIDTISSGVKGFLTLLNKISDFKYTPPKWLDNFGKFLGDLFGKFKTGIITKWTAGVAKLADAGEFVAGLFKSIKTSISTKMTAGVAKLGDTVKFVTDLFKSIKTSISTKITKGLKTVFGTLEFGPEFTKTISTAFDTVIKPVKTLLSGADGAGGFLGFFSKIGTFLKPIGKIIKSVGKLALPVIKTLMRPFLQIILTIFDFIGGAFAGFNESEGKGFVERIKYVVLRGLGGIVTGFTDIIDMIICDVVPWIAKQLGFDEFAKKLGNFGGISRFVTPIFDYIFGMGKNEADGGLPSAIGRLFAEKIPAALATAGAKFTAIGDSIGDMITEIGDWFTENFSLTKLLENSPGLKKALQFAGVVGMTKEDIEAAIAVQQEEIKKGDYNTGIGEDLYGVKKGEGSGTSRFEVIEGLEKQLASLQTGGITTQSGLINIHPQEAVIPLEKMDDVINKINTAAINKSEASGAPIVMAPSVVNAPTDARSSTTIHSGNPVPISAPFSYSSILDG